MFTYTFCKLVGIKCFHYLPHTIFLPIHLFGKRCLHLTKNMLLIILKIIFHGVDQILKPHQQFILIRNGTIAIYGN
jgi:hypothetical protein